MLRYISIGDQIIEDGDQFSLYDTVTDQFLEFNGCQVFDDVQDFFLWYDNSYPQHDLERIQALMPNG